MANFGYVKSRKKIDPVRLNTMLEQLNQARFHGNLVIDYSGDDNPSWNIRYVSSHDHKEYASRYCWLGTSRTFSMRHGGGGTFAWWVDQTIINEVALLFNGTITDDAEGPKRRYQGEQDYYPVYRDFFNMMNNHLPPTSLMAVYALECAHTPYEHRW